MLVTVITDGFENSSLHYTAAMVKELVESLSAKGWVFTYIGANQDSVLAAGTVGIKSTMDFQASVVGSAVMWGKIRSSNWEYYKKVRRARNGENVDFEEDFFAEKQAQDRVTPGYVRELRDGQILVLGSSGSRGLQGRRYAIPTMNSSLEDIAREVEAFIRFADIHPEKTFLVTRIGCGAAGYTDEQIAPLFASASSLPNVYLPASFWKVLNYRYNQ